MQPSKWLKNHFTYVLALQIGKQATSRIYEKNLIGKVMGWAWNIILKRVNSKEWYKGSVWIEFILLKLKTENTVGK